MISLKRIATRTPENRDCLRASVTEAVLLHTERSSCQFRTIAPLSARPKLSSAEPEMNEAWQKRLVNAERVTGTIRLDFFPETVRIRYAEGEAVPENPTAMIESLPQPEEATQTKTGDNEVFFHTAEYGARITLKPFQIELLDSSGNIVTTIGGPELNLFNNWDSFQTGMVRSSEDSPVIGTECFRITPGQAIYGLGEKFIGLNKAGQTIDLFTEDALGVISPRSYKNIPFFLTTQGYGVYFNHSSPMTFWAGSMAATNIQAAIQDDFLDYFVFVGSLGKILSSYTFLTGRPQMPPAWTFGFWQSKISYQSAGEVMEIARQMRSHEVPCDVIHLDTFWFDRDWYCDLEYSRERFPDPDAFFAELKEMGFKISLWQLPYIPEGNALFEELVAVDGFVRNAAGELYDCGICFTPGFKGQVGIIDYTNPQAVEVHQRWIGRLLAQGASVIKADFGEAAPMDGVYHDGSPGHQMHNLYPLLYNRALYDVTAQVTGEGVIWARSAWAGSQRYPLHWGGDNSPNFENMIPQLAGGLSLGLCGFPFWSQDIGGFCGTSSDRLMIRWMQMGVFMSHSRIHGYGDRELYKFSPETLRICRAFLQLRYRLLPYILSSAEQSVDRALPLARPLVLEFENDPTTWNIQDQFMLGSSLLVAPICTVADHRRLYLPDGTWTDWWTGGKFSGGRWMDIETDIERIPLFVREGGIIPLGPVCQQIDEHTGGIEEILVAPFENCGTTQFSLWNRPDQKITYRRQKGLNTISLPSNLTSQVRFLDNSKFVSSDEA